MCTLFKGCLCTVAVHLGKHERVLLAFSVLLMTLTLPLPRPCCPGRSVGDALAGLSVPAGDPARFSELALAKSCDLLDQVECWVSAKVVAIMLEL